MHPIAFGDVVVGLIPLADDFEGELYVEASMFDLDARVAAREADRRVGRLGWGWICKWIE